MTASVGHTLFVRRFTCRPRMFGFIHSCMAQRYINPEHFAITTQPAWRPSLSTSSVLSTMIHAG